METTCRNRMREKSQSGTHVSIRLSSGLLNVQRTTRSLLLGSMLLCLMMSGGCAGWLSQAPPQLASCYIPTKPLTKTVEPPMDDEKNKNLQAEATALRAALIQCNKDKEQAIKELQYQNQLRSQR